MQKVTYQNILGESITFMHGPYVLEEVKGTGSVPRTVGSISGVYQDGATATGIRRDHREVDIKFHIFGTTRKDLYQLREKLLGVLAAYKAFGEDERRAKLFYENDHGAWWTWAIPLDIEDFGKRIINAHGSIPLTFWCESANWYNLAPDMEVLAFSGEGFDLPFDFPIAFGSREFKKTLHNKGHVFSPVKIEIEGQGEKPAIVNLSTGARLQITSPLPVGHRLTINTDPANLEVTMIDAEGNKTNAYGYLDETTPLTAFTLRPGANVIEYEAGNAAAQSKITITWYMVFEGV